MEWTVVSIAIGLIVSLLFTEAFGVSVGGMIVPGYLALQFDAPASVMMTLLAALLTYVCVRQVSRSAIIFGRRRVVLTMLIGFAIGEALRQALAWQASMRHAEEFAEIAPSLSATNAAILAGAPVDVGVTVVGFVIPGLIALWIDRTSILQTLAPLMTASGLVHLVLIVVGMESFR
ncbi:MAG: poly-gamma-glutamate biosynthesis protein PgsC [Planctomycetota bacterium]